MVGTFKCSNRMDILLLNVYNLRHLCAWTSIPRMYGSHRLIISLCHGGRTTSLPFRPLASRSIRSIRLISSFHQNN